MRLVGSARSQEGYVWSTLSGETFRSKAACDAGVCFEIEQSVQMPKQISIPACQRSRRHRRTSRASRFACKGTYLYAVERDVSGRVRVKSQPRGTYRRTATLPKRRTARWPSRNHFASIDVQRLLPRTEPPPAPSNPSGYCMARRVPRPARVWHANLSAVTGL